MAEDWLADVRKYAPAADADVVAGLVRYCGIALRNRDSSLVSFSDPAELGRVREKFLKKKLALTQPDSLLDEALAAVGEIMKGDRTKNRVTVYYLLADRFGRLSDFLKAPKAGSAAKGVAAAGAAGAASGGARDADAKPAVETPRSFASSPPPPRTESVSTPAPTPTAPPSEPIRAAAPTTPPPAPPSEPTPVRPLASASAATGAAQTGDSGRSYAATGSGEPREPLAAYSPGSIDEEGGSKSRWWLWLLLGLLALLLLFFLLRSCGQDASAPGTASGQAAGPSETEVTPVDGAGAVDNAAIATPQAAVPEGAGVVSEMRDNLPALKVYFDVGKSDVSADLATAAGGIRDYVAANPTAKVIVSGFNDPTGNAAVNAEISKRRAQQVADALTKSGIPGTAILLEKPANATVAGSSNAESRRVEVTLRP